MSLPQIILHIYISLFEGIIDFAPAGQGDELNFTK